MLLDDDVLGHHSIPDGGDGAASYVEADAAYAHQDELPVIRATAEEAAAHEAMLEKIRKSGACVWDID